MHPHAYRLLTDSPARKKAKKLVEIVELMGFDLKLSRAQTLVAGLMGYSTWAELVHVTRASPDRGIPDQMLPPKEAATRRNRQCALLAQEFGIDDWDADRIVSALAPTGAGEGLDWPTVEKLRLRLAPTDVGWLEESMTLVRDFDAAVRPMFALAPAPTDENRDRRLTHMGFQRTVHGRRHSAKRDTAVADIVGWVADSFPDEQPLTGDKLAETLVRAERASRIFAALDARIRDLGPAPMLAPIDRVFLLLSRTRVSGRRTHYTALSPEPWLHIGFDLPGFCWNPENEWNASRALSLQLALRREFLDAGWTGDGPEWRIIFREGNSAKEEIAVQANSAGAAFAWAAAARAALRLAKRQSVGTISLLSIVGPDGAADIDQTRRAAFLQPVVQRGILLSPDRLRIRSVRKAAA